MKKATKKPSKTKPKTKRNIGKSNVKSSKTSKMAAKKSSSSRSGRAAAKPARSARVTKKPAAPVKHVPKPAQPAATRKRTASRRPSRESVRTATRRPGGGDSIARSAQQIWLAGLGALVAARKHGEKVLDELIRQGADLEKSTQELAERSLDEADATIEKTSEQARAHARQAWQGLEQAFEYRVGEVLTRLGIPARQEMDALMRHVTELTQQVQDLKSASQTRFSRMLDAGTRRARDDLSDLARELEEVQLAAKQSMKQGIAQVRKAIKDASR